MEQREAMLSIAACAQQQQCPRFSPEYAGAALPERPGWGILSSKIVSGMRHFRLKTLHIAPL